MIKLILTTVAIIVLAMNCPSAIADQTEKQTMQTKQYPVLNNAQEFIEFFRQGGKYYDKQKSLPNLMIGKQPDPQALKVLGEALATDTQDVRDEIVRLLRKIASLNHPARELRTPEVIDLLVGPGFAKRDSASSEAMDILREDASIVTLSRYGDIFLRELKKKPSASLFLLIAKAKPKGAREEVERLAKLPEWENDLYMRITQAALGNTKIEEEFIADAKQKEDAGDGRGLVKSFIPLVQICTPSTLRAVCLRLRSPLTYQFNFFTHPVYDEAMRALIYVYPEEADFLTNPGPGEEAYIRVEQFCELKTGVSFYGIPRPIRR